MKIIPRFLLIFFLFVTAGQWTPAHARSAKLENEMGVIFAPPPTYPHAARRQRITGFGVYALRIDDRGHVAAVYVVKSSGSRHLDAAAINTFKQWRFKPGNLRGMKGIRIPVRWELDGVAAGSARSWVY
jgi:TonB family protein